MDYLKKLKELRSEHKSVDTRGLDEKIIEAFLERDPRLARAIEDAVQNYEGLKREFGTILRHDEAHQIHELQRDFLNFYEDFNVNPYVALAAKGPWIVTSCGAVVYDTGGYGMLGFGHNPDHLLEALSRPQVMANVMTPNFSQWRFSKALNEEIGHHRTDGKRYYQFLCINSGSEATTVALRIADCHTKNLTDAGGSQAGKKIMFLSMKGSFHGRTEPSAQVSSSSLGAYQSYLASFRDRRNLISVEPNNLSELANIFTWAEKEGVYFQAMLLEPVMGEGNPGKAISPEYYKLARELTKKHDTMLIVDSIQAGFRVNACLSVVDYPGFESFDFPDMEAYSKALNGGQFPLSVLALNEKAARLYRYGIYGNTMTTNPRALDVGYQVLKSMTAELRDNIHKQGQYFLSRLKRLAESIPDVIISVQGTGLLFSVSFDEKKCVVLGDKGLERFLRKRGLGVIHGGKNALRFTPVFNINKYEADLVIGLLEKALNDFLAR